MLELNDYMVWVLTLHHQKANCRGLTAFEALQRVATPAEPIAAEGTPEWLAGRQVQWRARRAGLVAKHREGEA